MTESLVAAVLLPIGLGLFLMPRTMRRLALVQFLSWFGLFAMWIYTTSAVTGRHYGTTDAGSAAFNEGANWVGVLFAAYNGFAAVAALLIPLAARAVGRRWAHLVNLALGGAGLISFLFIDDPKLLLFPMAGVGIAWASILSLPYAMLSGAVPPAKMGIYMPGTVKEERNLPVVIVEEGKVTDRFKLATYEELKARWFAKLTAYVERNYTKKATVE